MRRALLVAIILAVVSAIGFAGGQAEEGSAVGDEGDLRVVLYLNGTLGDKSFFDSAARGVQMAEEQLGITARVIEGGYDPARWEPDIAQLAEGDWDIIIAGTWQLQEFIETYAPQHPDKYWFTYDTSVDYSKEGLENVYSILYSQNEGSFVVGALAAMMTTADMEHANPDPTVGFLGGMDIPVINDFLVGFEQGAQYVNSDVDVRVAYAGAFSDPAKGKELSLAMYDQGADVVFNVAGETGLGALDAAKERSRYAIGVDSDQYALFAESDPEKASYIVTSMMKNVDLSILRAIELHLNGSLPYGEAEVLGIAEGGVGVAANENFEDLVPEEFKAQLQEIEEAIASGEIQVDTAIGN